MKKENTSGFTIIELMVTVAVIMILAALLIPNYLGLQERAKRRAIIEVATSIAPEINHWQETAIDGQRGVIDVNGDALVTPGEGISGDLNNIPRSWIKAFHSKVGRKSLSPWFNRRGLFTVARENALQPGQINLVTLNNGRVMKIIALGKSGTTLNYDTISVD